MRRSVAAAAALLATVLAASPLLGLTDAGRRSYQHGLEAMGDQDWQRAVLRLREAAKDDPAEGLRKFRGSGVNYEDYFPHLYLGLALEKLERPAEAQKELEESQRQGASRERPRVASQLRAALSRVSALAVAQARPAPPPPVPTAPPANPVVPQPTVPLPTPTPLPPRPVPTLHPTAVATATPIVRPSAPPIPATPRPTIIPIPPPEPVGRVPGEVLAEVRSGIRSYFRGEFDAAIPVLERRRDASRTARLFLAYSLAGKYLLAPERDEALLSRARAEFRAAREGAPAREDRLISTAVRSILEKG